MVQETSNNPEMEGIRKKEEGDVSHDRRTDKIQRMYVWRTIKMKKYIDFHAIAPFIYNTKRVTSVYAVTSLSSGDQIGIIKWYAPWRQYCFFPDSETIWSNDCLENVQSILRGLNFAHKTMREMKTELENSKGEP